MEHGGRTGRRARDPGQLSQPNPVSIRESRSAFVRRAVPMTGFEPSETRHDLAHQRRGLARRLADPDPGGLQRLLLGGRGPG